MSEHPTSPTAFSALFEKKQKQDEPVAWVNWCAATGKRSVSFECESELASQPLYFGVTQNTQNRYSNGIEPAAWANTEDNSLHHHTRMVYNSVQFLDGHLVPLYTHPQTKRKWIGLTDEQKLSLEIQGSRSDVMLAELVEQWLKDANS